MSSLNSSAGDAATIPSDPNPPFQIDTETRRTVAFAAGRLLAIRGGTLIVTGVGSSTPIATLSVKEQDSTQRLKLFDIGLTPDGKYSFALACVLDNTGTDKTNPPSQQRTPTSAGNCGRRLAKVWRIDNPQELNLSLSTSDNLQVMAIGSSNGQILIAMGKGDGNVVVNRFEIHQDGSAKEVSEIALTAGAPLTDLLFSEKSDSLISVSADNLATAWNIAGTGRLEHRLGDGLPYDIAVDRSSGALATVGPTGYSVLSSDGRQVLLQGSIPQPPEFSTDLLDFSGVSLAANAKQLVVTQYGAIELWDVALRRRLTSINLVPACSASVALDPLGKYIAAGFFLPSICQHDHNDASAGIDYSHVPVLWTIDGQKPALFVDLTGGNSATKGRLPEAPSDNNDTAKKEDLPVIVGVGFSPDGQYLAVTRVFQPSFDRGSLSIYKRSGSPPGQDTFEGPVTLKTDNAPYFVSFSPDSQLLAVSQRNGDIALFDVARFNAESKPIGTMPSAGGDIGRVAISLDGKLLAVGHVTNGISLWDIASRTPIGSPIFSFYSNGGALTGVAFSSDGRRLITADAQLKATVAYDLDVESWIKQACDVARRSLSPEERANYGLPLNGPSACAPP
jgi:WD40 repeat protein